jgi:DNA-binding IclR family transcriptional regulator
MVRRDKDTYTIQTVSHALDVLEQFRADDELGVTELSKRLKLHKNNVFRILATLEARGYIEQNKATENYRLGTKCLELGQAYVDHMGLLRQAHPIMTQIVKECRESAYVAVMRGGAVIPLDAVESDLPIRIVSRVGESLPLHCTAVGKAHLAFEPEEDLLALLPEGLPRHTDKTITDREALMAQLRAIVRDGYSLEFGEYLADVNAIAVPIRDYRHSVVGSLAVSGPAYRIPTERVESEIAPLMIRAGRELSGRLGYKT